VEPPPATATAPAKTTASIVCEAVVLSVRAPVAFTVDPLRKACTSTALGATPTCFQSVASAYSCVVRSGDVSGVVPMYS
jgi:hypothetical protein